jgi:hypothetical protein
VLLHWLWAVPQALARCTLRLQTLLKTLASYGSTYVCTNLVQLKELGEARQCHNRCMWMWMSFQTHFCRCVNSLNLARTQGQDLKIYHIYPQPVLNSDAPISTWSALDLLMLDLLLFFVV